MMSAVSGTEAMRLTSGTLSQEVDFLRDTYSSPSFLGNLASKIQRLAGVKGQGKAGVANEAMLLRDSYLRDTFRSTFISQSVRFETLINSNAGPLRTRAGRSLICEMVRSISNGRFPSPTRTLYQVLEGENPSDASELFSLLEKNFPDQGNLAKKLDDLDSYAQSYASTTIYQDWVDNAVISMPSEALTLNSPVGQLLLRYRTKARSLGIFMDHDTLLPAPTVLETPIVSIEVADQDSLSPEWKSWATTMRTKFLMDRALTFLPSQVAVTLPEALAVTSQLPIPGMALKIALTPSATPNGANIAKDQLRITRGRIKRELGTFVSLSQSGLELMIFVACYTVASERVILAATEILTQELYGVGPAMQAYRVPERDDPQNVLIAGRHAELSTLKVCEI